MIRIHRAGISVKNTRKGWKSLGERIKTHHQGLDLNKGGLVTSTNFKEVVKGGRSPKLDYLQKVKEKR